MVKPAYSPLRWWWAPLDQDFLLKLEGPGFPGPFSLSR